MKSLSRITLIVFVVLATMVAACKKDPPIESEYLDINEFIWDGMNYYYLWYENVELLSDNRFESDQDKENYLAPISDHEQFFYSLLYTELDRFSWIVDDYVALENYFQGITVSMGYRYSLFAFGNEVIGVVKYVVKDSPAYNAGLKRGDLFSLVNGIAITSDNYRNLLGEEFYTLTMATIVDGSLQTTGTVHLTAVEVHENPVHYTTVIDAGDKIVGYMYYAGFRSNYEEELNDAFGEFLTQGVNELVLDLRYNGGGSVSTTAKLGSMIYDTDTNKIFIRKIYNDKYTAWLTEEYGESAFYWKLKDEISDDQGNTYTLNSLGLDHIYVLATGSSASASELLINCLRSYIDVTIIGSTTYGKNVGSMTIKDRDEDGNVNPDHTWAMQPIMSKSSNVDYESEYYVGFEPDYEVYEDLSNLLPWGDENDPLFKTALDLIQGISPAKSFDPGPAYETVAKSEDTDPWNYEMIDEIF